MCIRDRHMTIPEAKRTARIIEWRQLIHARQQSGQSVRAWCLRNGIRENSYYYWLRIIREEALCEAENKSGALVRVEPEKLAIETVSPQFSSGGIVIRANGVEDVYKRQPHWWSPSYSRRIPYKSGPAGSCWSAV